MLIRRFTLALVVLLFTGIQPVIAQEDVQSISDEERSTFADAYFAWDEGDYVESMQTLEELLQQSDNEALHARIAQLTGELYQTVELTDDGHSVTWGPAGDYGSYTTGDDADPLTHVIRVDGSTVEVVHSVDGLSPSFSPDGRSMAFVRIPETDELQEVRQREEEALEARNFNEVRRARAELLHLEAEAAEIYVLDLETGDETELDLADVRVYNWAYGQDEAFYVVGGTGDEFDRTQIFRIEGAEQPDQLTEGEGVKGFEEFLTMGNRLVYSVGEDRLALMDLETLDSRTVEGVDPAISADGSTLVFTRHEEAPAEAQRGEAIVGADVRSGGQITSVHTTALAGEDESSEVLRTNLPLQHVSLSPSGDRITYSKMLRDSWDVFVSNVETGEEERITREIQHEYFPQFISDNEIMTLFGEARHRRAYLYEINRDDENVRAEMTIPGADERGRIQLFHNNTLRTIAPQYEWEVSPNGSHLLVVADRDGDTVAPENGVYLVDLTQQVSREDLLARVQQNLEDERDLRERGEEMFADIADEVREATVEINVGRAFDHAHALYQFDSKWFEEEGNQRAIEYLSDSFEQMGYEVELEWFEPRDGPESANVIATLEGTTNPDQVYMITSHFDSVPGSPGADDNTSGTVAMLEAARVLADRPQHATIKFVLLTAEEAGLLGAYENAARLQEDGVNVAGVINNDMIGWTRSHRLDNTIRYSNETIRDIQHTSAIQFSDLITYDARYVRGTDAFVYFQEFGDILGGTGSYPVLSNPHYHQPHDILEVQNHRLVAEVSRATTGAIMKLASSAEPVADLEVSPGSGDNAEITWTASRETNVAHYTVRYGPEDDPHRYEMEVSEPHARISNGEPGWTISVQAVSEDGVHGWGASTDTLPNPQSP